MNELALFAGVGGGILGGKLLGWQCVCAVEIDPYRQAVLLARQADGSLTAFPIWDDVRTFNGRAWRGVVDIVTAGFPCQPASRNGKRRAASDHRWLWPETLRIYRESGAKWLLAENVEGLLSVDAGRAFGGILRDLAAIGCSVRWGCLSGAGLGAPHERTRVWIVAHAESARRPRILRHHTCNRLATISSRTGSVWTRSLDARCDTVHALEQRLGEPALFGTDDGNPDRVDQLAALGDGQIPAVVVRAWRELTRGLEDERGE